jgi:hypothetical protein
MKSINKAATVRYLEKTLGPLPDFDGVSWRCQHLSTLCEHSIESYPTSDAHGGAHKLIHDLVDRSDGNFLWLSLVTRTIRKLSRMGIGLAGIEKTIDEMPDDLDFDPLATLRRYLPMDADSEWPALLESYQQPKKREELREARRKLVDSLERQSKEKMLV